MASFLATQTPPSSFLPRASSFPTRLTSLLHNRSPLSLSHTQYRLGVRCSYAEASTKEDSFSAPIDVVANVRTERVRPSNKSWFMGRSGDVFYLNWDEVLPGATAVVSTIGGFGNEEQMQRINGEANVVAVDAAKDYGIPKFIFISVHDYNLPSFLLSSAYFTGKRKAESEVLSKYPNSGVVLRPGFIYGKRRVDGFEIPLDLIGEPLERILQATENFTRPLSSLPASDLLLAPPVSVDDVAFAVINAITDDDFFGVYTIEQIKEAAQKVKVSSTT